LGGSSSNSVALIIGAPTLKLFEGADWRAIRTETFLVWR